MQRRGMAQFPAQRSRRPRSPARRRAGWAHQADRQRRRLFDGLKPSAVVDYVRLAKTYDATLYVDDAHGFGVIGEAPDEAMLYGQKGNGVVRHFDLDYVRDRIVFVAGMSKAVSSYAAFVTCNDLTMKNRLQGSGPYVFSGPTCTASLASALAGLKVNRCEGEAARAQILVLPRNW